MQDAANILQLVGALVTFLGLWHAYTRSKYGLGLLPWLASKFRHRTVEMSGSTVVEATGEGTAIVDAYPGFVLDTTLPIEGQLAQLADYVRELRLLFPSIGQKFSQVDRDIADARAHAESVAAQALGEMRREHQQIAADQDRTTVLDLRIAIVGLAISFVGTVLAFWA